MMGNLKLSFRDTTLTGYDLELWVRELSVYNSVCRAWLRGLGLRRLGIQAL